ncbi:MAG: hypothetical protein NUV34_10500 [Sulfuricaulis sp.]|nr:hypothetical protein [Sulfuricaulis sp.]
MPSEMSLFNILMSVLMLVVGFLLNRVFSEIDKLTSANGKLKEALFKDYVTRGDFIRHEESEVRTMDRMGEEIGKRFDKLDILLEAVRVKQQGQ